MSENEEKGGAWAWLKKQLSPAQWEEYAERRHVDAQDAKARQLWRYVRQARRAGGVAREKDLEWLFSRGYIDDSGHWTGITREK